MNKKEMCERLCALSENEIVKYRKPLVVPLFVTAAGAGMVAANALLPGEEWVDLKSVLLLAGSGLFLAGLVVSLIRLFGSGGVPYSLRTGEYLRYEELYFPKERMREVVRYCSEGDVETLRRMGQASVPAVVVSVYSTKDGAFAACQPFEYVELEYRPLGEMSIRRT